MSRRSHRGTASLRCGLTHVHEDGPPGGKKEHRRFENVRPARRKVLKTAAASPHLDESGAARLTLVWLLSRVDAGVSLEIGWSVKLGAADVAVVRFRTWGQDGHQNLDPDGGFRRGIVVAEVALPV